LQWILSSPLSCLPTSIEISTIESKKIDVFKDSKRVASIGATEYSDYPTYVISKGIKYANERRRLYLKCSS
jgi:hypothetical protein